MIPCRCQACGRRNLSRNPNTHDPGLPVAHVRDDIPGMPCKVPTQIEYPNWGTMQELQIDNLNSLELD